jgi:hypothetical protein
LPLGTVSSLYASIILQHLENTGLLMATYAIIMEEWNAGMLEYWG